MDHDFWNARWKESRHGFHQEEVNPQLKAHRAPLLRWRGATPPGSVLVPLCGKSFDLTWLAEHETVVGVEFVETAVLQYFEEHHLEPVRSSVDGVTCYSADKLRVLVADFFQLTQQQVGPISWVYDRAALVAIEPHRREEYIRKLQQLTVAGAGLLLLSFEHDVGSGPPFSVPDVEALLTKDAAFEVLRCESQDILDEEPRFREKGATFMRQDVWYGRRPSDN